MTQAAENKINEKRYNVLIVDDEPPVRRLIDCLLKELEYTTHQASNGDEAIAILKKNDNVDLIIMDLLLPGKHGLDICSKIRAMESFRDIPILVITAVYTKSKYNYQSREYGANAFMTKPFDNDAFLDQVARLIHMNTPEEICVDENV